MRIHCGQIATAIILLLSAVVGTCWTALAEPSGPATAGYITRLSVPATTSSDTDMIVQVVAFFSEDGRYSPEPVKVSIIVAQESAELQGTGRIGETVKEKNFTINDNQIHKVSLGRLEQGTYRVRAVFHTERSGDLMKEDSVAVLHPPVDYSISLDTHKVIFHGLGNENETFTVTIKVLYSPEHEESLTRGNITNLTYRITGTPQILAVWVIDKYGNVNGLNNGRAYVITFTKPSSYYLYRPFVALTIVAIGVILIVYMKKHEVVA